MTDAPQPFTGDHAAAYDKRNAFWAPMRAALDAASEAMLRDVSDTARVLCVGAGTGAEIAFFASRRPGWHFTAVDTSADMLAICRDKAQAGGYADRCTFHEGPIETLEGGGFDVATAILVSQFITDRSARIGFYGAIAQRLLPGGNLLSVDLSAPEADGDAAINLWLSMQRPDKKMPPRDQFDAMVAVLSPEDLCELIEKAGFTPPRQYFQYLLMRAFWAQAKPETNT